MRPTDRIRNSEDILDSRDIIARIDFLESIYQDSLDEDGGSDLDDEELEELEQLKSLAEEASYSPDWNYGETLIRDSYFTDYAEELAEETVDMPIDEFGNTPWPINHIDWKAAADALKRDYFNVDFDGVTYWIRQ